MPSVGHDIPPYPHHSVPFGVLPLGAQKLLLDHGLTVDHYDPNAVEEVRCQRAAKLYHDLQAVFDALVLLRREVVAINAALENLEPGPEYEKAEEAYVEIARCVFHDLLPEMHGRIDQFIAEADALVWFEHHVREGTPHAVSREEIERYRDAKMTPIIERAFDLLFKLDTAIVLKDLEAMDKVGDTQGPPLSMSNRAVSICA
ncbi:hypothetical protein FPV67DRAFT_1413742 [Lyophyllum atratum]|nr:hypothetical protein FPV67DRAFT_1413742 [Lyophyllum atratum]